MSDHKIGIYDAKTTLTKLIARIERGESITITRHGKAVARLVPVEEETQRAKKDAVSALRVFGKGRKLGGISVREMIEEGRR